MYYAFTEFWDKIRVQYLVTGGSVRVGWSSRLDRGIGWLIAQIVLFWRRAVQSLCGRSRGVQNLVPGGCVFSVVSRNARHH